MSGTLSGEKTTRPRRCGLCCSCASFSPRSAEPQNSRPPRRRVSSATNERLAMPSRHALSPCPLRPPHSSVSSTDAATPDQAAAAEPSPSPSLHKVVHLVLLSAAISVSGWELPGRAHSGGRVDTPGEQDATAGGRISAASGGGGGTRSPRQLTSSCGWCGRCKRYARCGPSLRPLHMHMHHSHARIICSLPVLGYTPCAHSIFKYAPLRPQQRCWMDPLQLGRLRLVGRLRL